MASSIDPEKRSASEGTPGPRPACGTAHDFTAQVIYDGRFLGSFTAEPERVAEQLGIGLSPEVTAQVRGSDARQLLTDTTHYLAQKYSRTKEAKEISAKHVPAIVIGFGVAIVCLALDNPDGPPVDDESQEADYKL